MYACESREQKRDLRRASWHASERSPNPTPPRARPLATLRPRAHPRLRALSLCTSRPTQICTLSLSRVCPALPPDPSSLLASRLLTPPPPPSARLSPPPSSSPPPPRSPTVYQDRFNLYGLKEIIGPLYGEAMSMILGYAPSEKQLSDPTQRIHKVLDTARVLYGLIHARYILTAQGLQDMKAKYKASGLQKNPSTQPHPNPSPKPSQPTLL